MYTDKITQAIAEAAKKILEGEKLHPNQQKIDVVDDEKIDGKDFAKLRAMKKEEVEQIDETTGAKLRKVVPGLGKFVAGQRAEKARAHSRGGGPISDDPSKQSQDDKARLSYQKKAKRYEKIANEEVEGMVQPSFSDLMESYREGGLKGFFENFQVVQEEPTNDEYTAEVKKAQAKSEGKDKADVAKAAVQAVQSEEVEQIDEISVNTKLKYLDAAEKSRKELNKKWDQGKASQKEKESVISREDGQARAEKSIKKKTGKYSNQLSKFDKLRYKITKEEVEQIDNED